MEKPTPPLLTPLSEAQKLVTVLVVTPSQEQILPVLRLTLTLSQVAPRSVKRELFSPNYKPKAGRYKGYFTKLAKKVRISTVNLFRSRKIMNQKHARSLSTKKVIQAFMNRPDNSFELPRKKDNVRGETHYVLADSSYMSDHPLLSQCQHFVGCAQLLLSWQDLCRGRFASAKTMLILHS